MSDVSTRLQLSYLAPAQAQKHVTVNESLRRLDALVQASAISRSVSTQPAAPDDGAVYLLPPGKTGERWNGMANHSLAYYCDGAWESLVPRAGWRVYVEAEGALLVYDGAGWRSAAADRVARAGDEMSGPLTLTGGEFRVGADTLTVKSGRVALGTEAQSAPARFTVERSNAEIAYFGPQYNGGVAYNEGDVRLTVSAWNGAPEIFLVKNHVNAARLTIDDVDASFALHVSYTPRLLIDMAGAVKPGAAASQDLGSAALPWNIVYAASGVVTTSDARAKTDICACPLGLDFLLALQPVAFRLRPAPTPVIAPVIAEGSNPPAAGMRLPIGVETASAADAAGPAMDAASQDDAARRLVHTGLLAQDVRAALPEGFDWAGWVADPADPDTPQGLRYEALIAPMIAAIQELNRRIAALELT